MASKSQSLTVEVEKSVLDMESWTFLIIIFILINQEVIILNHVVFRLTERVCVCRVCVFESPSRIFSRRIAEHFRIR